MPQFTSFPMLTSLFFICLLKKKSVYYHLTSVNICRFDQCSISPLSLKGIKDAGFEKMTVVQEATLPVILKGLFSTVLLRCMSTNHQNVVHYQMTMDAS
jgi:superfamily II DNA/RNA helicase